MELYLFSVDELLAMKRVCAAAGCNRSLEPRRGGRGLCKMHYERHRRHGDAGPAQMLRRKARRGPTYQKAHRTVDRLWGKATQYPCVECGHAASHWAYDGSDPSQLLGRYHTHANRGEHLCSFYSEWPEFYMPMCNKCHSARDAKERYKHRVLLRTLLEQDDCVG